MIEYSDKKTQYQTLLDDIRVMVSRRSSGYDIAQKLNDEMWEELGTHQRRLEEQLTKVEGLQDQPTFKHELSTADSIYEATKNYLTKFK